MARRSIPTLLVLMALIACPQAGWCFGNKDTVAEALDSFRRAELNRGDERKREQSYRRAERLALEILDSHPDNADAHFLIFAVRGRRALADGISMSEAWQFPQLNRHLEKTLAVDPDHALALAAKGGLLLDLPKVLGGDPKRSVPYLRRAHALNPDGVGTGITLSRALMRAGRSAEAKNVLLSTAHRAIRQRDSQAVRDIEALLSKHRRESGEPMEAAGY